MYGLQVKVYHLLRYPLMGRESIHQRRQGNLPISTLDSKKALTELVLTGKSALFLKSRVNLGDTRLREHDVGCIKL